MCSATEQACQLLCDWLAGRGYRMITVTANVGYSYANGTTFESTLTLAIWEDWSIA